MLRRLKDAALEKGVMRFLGPKVARYGELKSLKINTAKKFLSAEIQLLGEDAPLVVSEAHYRLEPDGGRLFAIINKVQVSKPWLQNLIDDRFEEVRLEVPQSFRTLVKYLM